MNSCYKPYNFHIQSLLRGIIEPACTGRYSELSLCNPPPVATGEGIFFLACEGIPLCHSGEGRNPWFSNGIAGSGSMDPGLRRDDAFPQQELVPFPVIEFRVPWVAASSDSLAMANAQGFRHRQAQSGLAMPPECRAFHPILRNHKLEACATKRCV